MTLNLDRRALLGLLAASAAAPRTALAADYPRPDREAMVPVEGGRVYARLNGEVRTDRPPILLIHGGPGGNHAGYLPFLALAAERGVVLYDQLDSGRSDAPNDPRNWRVARFVDEVDAIRRAFGLERLHVYGGSWGGTIALEYAARQARGLASVILQSPLVSTRSWLADAHALRASLPADTQAMLRRCESRTPPPRATCETADAAFYSRFLRRRPRPAEIEAYLRTLPSSINARIYEAMWGRTEFVSTGSLSHYDGEPLLARLNGERTLFVCGQYDEARPATIEGFARRVPGAEFAVIPGAGHGIANDRPDELLAVVHAWLRRKDAA